MDLFQIEPIPLQDTPEPQPVVLHESEQHHHRKEEEPMEQEDHRPEEGVQVKLLKT